MPLALLLQETVYTLRWGAFHLEPWTHLVRVEELLIDRARGAFLTRWFGSGLPLQGFYVNVVIENLTALRDQYLCARQSLPPAEEGPSLAEPLAGLAGEVAGILLSPTGAVLAVAVMVRDLRYWTKTLKDTLGWAVLAVPFEPLLGPVFGPIVLPFIAGSELRQYYAILAPAAKLLLEATKFLKLLLGPREKIENPLLRDILKFFDQLAVLAPFVIAFVAFVVVEIGPLIVPLAEQIEPFQGLIGEVVATVSDIFADIPRAYHDFMPLVADRLDFVLVQLGNVFPVFSIAFTELFTNLSDELSQIIDKGQTAVTTWFTDAKETGKAIIESQPLTQQIESAKISFKVASKALSTTGPKSPPGWLSRHTIGFVERKVADFADDFAANFPRPPHLIKPGDFLTFKGGPPPGGLGAIDTLAGIDIKFRGALFQDYLPLSDTARTGLEALKPTRVFDTEHGALVRQIGEEPKKALAALRVEQMKLRELLSAVVGRVLPAELRVQIGALRDVFAKLDVSLYQSKAEKPDYPVRDLPDNGQLRPIVHRLVIRGIGLVRADADTFQQRLQEAMNALAYPATRPAESAAMAGS
jgi:hypothetical protein